MSSTLILCLLAGAFLIAGLVLAVIPNKSDSLTVMNNETMITVRNVGTSGLVIKLDPTPLKERVVEVSRIEYDMEKYEISPLDELISKDTPLERKRQIAEELKKVGYDINPKILKEQESSDGNNEIGVIDFTDVNLDIEDADGLFGKEHFQ